MQNLHITLLKAGRKSNQPSILISSEGYGLTETQSIFDLYIRELTPEESDGLSALRVLGSEDHLLRRFGQLDVIRKSPNSMETMSLREVADEVWALLEGEVEFAWHDLRPDSPSHDNWQHLRTGTPTLVLAPFGVAFGYRQLGESALLLRLSTHAEGSHPGDRVLPWTNEA